MKGVLKRKKRRFWLPVMACFIILYLTIMWLVTLQVKNRFENEYNYRFEEIAASLVQKASNQELAQKDKDIDDPESKASTQEEEEDERWDDGQRKRFYQELVNEYFWSMGNPSLHISAAVYDEEGKLLAQSSDRIGDMMSVSSSEESYGPYILDEYLTFEQKEKLAFYYGENRRLTEECMEPENYRILSRISADGQELYDIYVQELTWEEGEEAQNKQYRDPLTESIHSVQTGTAIDYVTGKETGEEKTYYETDSKVVWEWSNPEVSTEQKDKGEIRNMGLAFPYISSYEDWHRWSSSEYLHGFQEEKQFTWGEGGEYHELSIYADWIDYRTEYRLKIGFIDDPSAYLIVRMEENPWYAAFDYMKTLYFVGALLTLGCMVLTIAAFDRVYERQMALEEMRRDFSNAMAHELKTPLGIIRNFAENLIEHSMEEKRDYYLTQIIGQTEEMDHLVAEMIEISKLDSEELVLRKEPVSFGELIRGQMSRLELLADEKNLCIEYQEEADFQVEADREYLTKAVWNLLANAVEYNVLDGRILIRTEAKRCSIENTGEPLGEEELLHAFDLFYTGDKNRGRREKHMGLGLFLAKKIFDLHGMNLTIENTDEGVRVIIKKI